MHLPGVEGESSFTIFAFSLIKLQKLNSRVLNWHSVINCPLSLPKETFSQVLQGIDGLIKAFINKKFCSVWKPIPSSSSVHPLAKRAQFQLLQCFNQSVS